MYRSNSNPVRKRTSFQRNISQNDDLQNESPPKPRVSQFLHIYFNFQRHFSHFNFLKICDILSEFCARSTIHGVGHFVAQKRHWIER